MIFLLGSIILTSYLTLAFKVCEKLYQMGFRFRPIVRLLKFVYSPFGFAFGKYRLYKQWTKKDFISVSGIDILQAIVFNYLTCIITGSLVNVSFVYRTGIILSITAIALIAFG